MGWIWSCFGGKKERLRRSLADGRGRQRYRDRSSTQAPPPISNSLSARLKSPSKEEHAYQELSQGKQAVASSPNASKLFKRKSLRRAKSFGSSVAFENGTKRNPDKNTQARTTGRVDRLEVEVENLRRRLAEEEEEARKLRNEVCYLRSCGVLQSPDQYRTCCDFDKESALSGEDKAQRNLQSWLGLALSPASRFRLEEQLRCMAADEMSKVPDKGLTNGQKALIVAAKLWQYQGDPQQDKQIASKLVNPCTSDGDASLGDASGAHKLRDGETLLDQLHKESPQSDYQLTSSNQDPSFRGDLKFEEDSSMSKSADSMSTSTTSDETECFSFHSSPKDDLVNDTQRTPVRELALRQRVASCPEEVAMVSPENENALMTEKCPCSVLDSEKFESPRKSYSLLSGGTGSQTSDHVEARRFIDLRYQELEEKLLKSPNKDVTIPESSPPKHRKKLQLGSLEISEHDVLRLPHDLNSAEAPDLSEILLTDAGSSLSFPAVTSLFGGKSGRLWQPLSPVWEADSGRSSGEDLETTRTSRLSVSDSADSATTYQHDTSERSILPGNEREPREDSHHHINDIGDVPDDDLFTLSPRRLHHSYDPSDHPHKVDEVQDEWKSDSNVDLGPATSWTSSADADFDDLAPIQCQSPAFSPKQKLSRKKYIKGKDLKLEEYPRDKYFKEMDFKEDEFIFSSDPCVCTDFPVAEKENCEGIEVPPVISVGHMTMMGPPKEASPIWKKSGIATDVSLSQSCDTPVLASIENLPKWIECQGVSVDKESQYQGTHILDIEENELAMQDAATGESSNLKCFPERSGGSTHQLESSPKIQVPEELELGLCQQAVKDHEVSPVEFSARQDESPQQTGGSLDCRVSQFRLSLHGFVYQEDGHVLDHRYSTLEERLVQEEKVRHDGNKRIEDEFLNCGGALDSFLMTLVGEATGSAGLGQSEHKERIDVVDGEVRVPMDSQVLGLEKGDVSEGKYSQHQDQKKSTGIPSNHVQSRGQSLGYSIQILRPTEFFPGTGLALESSDGGDSGLSSSTSRDGDETCHDCESPTLMECHSQRAQCSGQHFEMNPVLDDTRTSRFCTAREVHPEKRTVDISPDDRPILGTVATYWGDNNNPKSHREWDGLGIPNSTSKFKEDQRVNWHTTPFETRLEQALAKQPMVPELCNQRFVLAPDTILV